MSRNVPVADDALALIEREQQLHHYAPEMFHPYGPIIASGIVQFLRPRPGLSARLERDARLRAARRDVSRAERDFVPRDARLLPQVHRRRAHAADRSQRRTAAGQPAVRVRPARAARAGAARPGASVSRRREGPRRRPLDRRRRDGGRHDVAARAGRRGAADDRFSDQESSEDVAYRVPPRYRGARSGPAVRRRCSAPRSI